VPRGATIAVRLDETLDSETTQAGDRFRASLSSPFQEGLTTYAPLESEVEGVVEESLVTQETDPRARLSLRLTSLRLPNRSDIALDTVPMVRESGFDYQDETISVTTGLDVNLDYLLGRTSEPKPALSPDTKRVVIPQDSPLVFTLQQDVSLPAP